MQNDEYALEQLWMRFAQSSRRLARARAAQQEAERVLQVRTTARERAAEENSSLYHIASRAEVGELSVRVDGDNILIDGLPLDP